MNEPKIKHGWLRATLSLLSLSCVILLLSIPAAIILAHLAGIPLDEINFTNRENINVLIIFQLMLAAGTTWISYLFINHIDGKRFVSLGLFRFRMKKDMVAGILLGVVLIGSGFTVLYISGFITI